MYSKRYIGPQGAGDEIVRNYFKVEKKRKKANISGASRATAGLDNAGENQALASKIIT